MPMSASRKAELDALCAQFRRDVLKAVYAIQSGHIGGSFSLCEILTVLYFEKMRVDSSKPRDPGRDRLVLSKGHAAPILYRVLAEKGYFPVSDLDSLRRINSHLQGHPSMDTPGIDMPSGPLGMGLSAAQGMAIGLRLSGSDARVYAVLGDGEINEGTIWEAAMSAHKYKLDNLTAVLDYNGVQLDGTNEQIMPLLDVEAKWRGFGWNVISCDGHDVCALSCAFDEAKAAKGLPSIIIARTVKGKGVSFMEGKNGWHGKPPSESEYNAAMAELGGAK